MQDVDLSTLDPRVLINHVVFRVFPDFFSGEQGFGPWVPKKEELAPRGAQAQVQVQIQVHLGKHCSKRLFKLGLWAKDQQDWIN